MSAVFTTVAPHAGVNAEQIRVRTIDAFTQGNTDFGDGRLTCIANGKKVAAPAVIFTGLSLIISVEVSEDAASHENMGLIPGVCLYLLQAFIDPVYTVFAVNHGLRCLITDLL